VEIHAADSYYKCGWTNLEGRRVKGVPVTTVLRGRVIFEDGVVTGQPGEGRLVVPHPPEDRIRSVPDSTPSRERIADLTATLVRRVGAAR
jgi:hypothetical protein